MSRMAKVLLATLAAGCVAAPVCVEAAEKINVSCNVAVDYALNGTVQEPYRKDFTLQPGAGFIDDFSTNLRQKTFTASVAREAGNVVVAIDYFNDVGVFVAVGFNTRLTFHNDRGVETTAGSHTFSTSQGVAGNHTTSYTLSCRRI